jgi:hypothetical protein
VSRLFRNHLVAVSACAVLCAGWGVAQGEILPGSGGTTIKTTNGTYEGGKSEGDRGAFTLNSGAKIDCNEKPRACKAAFAKGVKPAKSKKSGATASPKVRHLANGMIQALELAGRTERHRANRLDGAACNGTPSCDCMLKSGHAGGHDCRPQTGVSKGVRKTR